MGYGDKRAISWALEEEDALPLLEAAWDRGINTWDTSCSYSSGVSESIFGAAICKYNIPRHKLIILTKCYNPTREELTPEVVKMERKDLVAHPDYVN